MKKLFMSMAAVVLLSSGAFAGTGTKAPKANLENKAVESKSSLKAVEEIKETKVADGYVCNYLLKVYENGVVVGSYRETYTVWSNWSGGSEYQSCGAWVKSRRQIYSQWFIIY